MDGPLTQKEVPVPEILHKQLISPTKRSMHTCVVAGDGMTVDKSGFRFLVLDDPADGGSGEFVSPAVGSMHNSTTSVSVESVWPIPKPLFFFLFFVAETVD